jgi:hypothetical protein
VRRTLPLLRLALAALCGLTVAVALIPDTGSAASHHRGALRQAPAGTDTTPCTDDSCDTAPLDPCEYDDSCYDSSGCEDEGCDDTTPDDGCTDQSCDDGSDTTPTDANGAPGVPDPAQTIAAVLRRGYYDAGEIPVSVRGSLYATLDEANARGAHTPRGAHRRHRPRASALARTHESAHNAGQIHVLVHLTGHGRHVLRSAHGALTLTLTMTIRLHGSAPSTSTATFSLPLR